MSRKASLKLARCVLSSLLLLATLSAVLYEQRGPARLPTARQYYKKHCSSLWRQYQPLISASLAPYEDCNLSVTSILNLQGWTAHPQVIVLNNTVQTLVEPALNTKATLIPLLTKLSSVVTLSDFVAAGNIMDQPEDDITREGGPWFGYCNHLMESTNIVYPAGPPVAEKLTCGTECLAFGSQDKRKAKAVFLGSSTGWANGRRRAVILAGIEHSDKLYSGYTQLIGIDQQTRDSKDPAIRSEVKASMSLLDQVRQYKYIINVDGHCAANRLRHLLASDSVVFWVQSDEVEWFYSLLQPFVHYVPVRFSANDPKVMAHDILLKLQWAEENPATMARITQNANKFAGTHLSEHGIQCYSIQLFDEYARLFTDSIKLRQLAKEGTFQNSMVHVHLPVP